MNRSFEIYSDCQDVIPRLKEIDKDYFVVYNLDRKTFELHNHSQENGTFCLTLPFESLDERAISLTLKTQSFKRDELIKELDAENEKLEKQRKKDILNDMEAIYES